jgi:hypothetical protein
VKTDSAIPSSNQKTRRALLGGGALAAAAAVPAIVPGLARADANGNVIQSPSSSSDNLITPTSASVLPVAVRAVSGQTANLQEWQNAAGNAQVAVDATGRLTRPATGAGHGPFSWDSGTHNFNGVANPVMYLGYNVSDGGNPIVAGEPYAAQVFEADYDDGRSRNIEMYWEVRNADNTINLRPFGFVLKRDAKRLEDFLITSGICGNPVLMAVPRTGGNVNFADFQPNRVNLHGVDDQDNVLKMTAQPRRNSQIIMHSSGVEAMKVRTVTPTQGWIEVGGRAARIYAINNSGAATLALNADDNSSVGLFSLAGAYNGTRGVTVRSKVGQTANLLEIQSPTNAPIAGIDRNGAIFTGANSAPATNDIAAGQAFVWFDSTPGAAKLMIRAKNAIGALVTGSVPLS